MNDSNAGYILTEIWNARPSWTSLTSEQSKDPCKTEK